MNKEIDLLDKEIIDTEAPKQRPVFVTVLCILTFCGAGITIFSSLFSILTMGQLETSMNEMNKVFDDTNLGMDFGNSYRWMKISYVLNLVGSLLCLAGALFMWKLKKIGFYIYIVGQVLPIIGSFMTMNSIKLGAFAGFGIIASIIGMMFPIAFIIMYGLNLKHMK
jgi:hypothetical protein